MAPPRLLRRMIPPQDTGTAAGIFDGTAIEAAI
jgi:hypothetical protein